MSFRHAVLWIGGPVALLATLYASQKDFRVYPSLEPYDDVALPADYQEKT
jgi:hypothetical protein